MSHLKVYCIRIETKKHSTIPICHPSVIPPAPIATGPVQPPNFVRQITTPVPTCAPMFACHSCVQICTPDIQNIGNATFQLCNDSINAFYRNRKLIITNN